MRRREFIALLGAAAAGGPVAAQTQRSAPPVIGVLSSQSQETERTQLAAVRQGLQETGFVEGRNVAFEYRFADGRADRLAPLAAELVQRPVTLILANTTPPAHAAKAATATIPIVFVT